ncbi:Methylmalonic aciduria and homocystinuria type D-like, mitochondrial [Porphyridium purpureum]|uniref:Methylmalonic aciduria and homocystinuria type D-like, mitochondrial n=1 Tax=Porphyridium purpureum TaxID=35688 RepID=A0A5J4Z8Q2_PORPP|nr:Methylmalonic aciduria and homocystinuria type D-like, mitochondrial [Porphyridium purpureum]|eukprot:POR5173..scf295_1
MAETLVGPTRCSHYVDFEYSVHTCPSAVLREVAGVFPDQREAILSKDPSGNSALLIVPTFQKAAASLLSWGDVQAAEKDRLLEEFLRWSKQVCDVLWAQGYWADVTDPCTGLPYYGTAGAQIYSDVHANMTILKYETENVGGCVVMAHPEWKYASYPATLFTTAPLETLHQALAST